MLESESFHVHLEVDPPFYYITNSRDATVSLVKCPHVFRAECSSSHRAAEPWFATGAPFPIPLCIRKTPLKRNEPLIAVFISTVKLQGDISLVKEGHLIEFLPGARSE